MFGDLVINKILAGQAAVGHFRKIRFDDSTVPEYYPNILPAAESEINLNKTFSAEELSSILLDAKGKSCSV